MSQNEYEYLGNTIEHAIRNLNNMKIRYQSKDKLLMDSAVRLLQAEAHLIEAEFNAIKEEFN